MSKFLYFAYGSNMLFEWLSDATRCPSAKFVSVASATGYTLRYWKKSQDGSSKATLIGRDTEITYGIVFEIDETELKALDRAEGAIPPNRGGEPGYRRVEGFNVKLNGEAETRGVVTYLANDSHICQNSPPYDWYVALVLAGARQNKLGAEYVATNLDVDSRCDDNLTRKTRCTALKVLGGMNTLEA